MAEILLNHEQALTEIEEMMEELRRRKAMESTLELETTSTSRFKDLDNEALFRKLIGVETSVYGPPSTMESSAFTAARLPRLERRGARETRAPHVIQRNSDAVVALVLKANLDRQAQGIWVLRGRTAGEDFDLCPEEPFHSRLAAAHGTGVLVGSRTILTARHLFNGNNPVDLSRFYFLFGYEGNRTRFTDQEVYDGALARVTAEDRAPEEDWALVELDREVGRAPVEVRANGRIGDEDKVYVIGHPLGISKQAAGEARVQNNAGPQHFFANLDVYERSSGSPVFNAAAHRLEGIVIAGDDPLFALPRRPCQVTRRCRGERCQGPAILRIGRIIGSPAFQNRQ